ncbi:hypothetical protein SAMN06298216_1065 [Spirosomataceae bacterium TFI 002]|nr:hypothetical protein SAMN06298216_1065 [Spirosomataceae bacterium TFI 002]
MELSNMEWWAIIGVALIIIEIFAVSFFFLFFGIGALATSLLAYTGIADDLSSQLIVFLLVSGVSILAFRKQVLESFRRKGENYQEMVKEKAKVSKTFENGEGKVFFRGADWMAFTKSETEFKEGESVIITKVDGIKLEVKAV